VPTQTLGYSLDTDFFVEVLKPETTQKTLALLPAKHITTSVSDDVPRHPGKQSLVQSQVSGEIIIGSVSVDF
jgi:hypothetical protein